ncbi:hypothetical protein QJS10_CPB12g01120 [Acorus calamus]|uniref:Uncharacterized protein n=1 Tax=Acorus calamus TaxID=4465 RepID=A0AAV9DMY1_ACOCL|nr:hypothetical protein QJS10_CPB12g01120 [Acorus calamus]
MKFHRVHVGDSGAVVTPFVQVATYATRNFATLGQLELLPPFTGAYIQSKMDFSFQPSSTGQESTPSPEVTGSFCRVPSTWFSRRQKTLFTCVGLGYDDDPTLTDLEVSIEAKERQASTGSAPTRQGGRITVSVKVYYSRP